MNSLKRQKDWLKTYGISDVLSRNMIIGMFTMLVIALVYVVSENRRLHKSRIEDLQKFMIYKDKQDSLNRVFYKTYFELKND